jgi:hypothetical protein
LLLLTALKQVFSTFPQTSKFIACGKGGEDTLLPKLSTGGKVIHKFSTVPVEI